MAVFNDHDSYFGFSSDTSQMDLSVNENVAITSPNVNADINWQIKHSNYTPKVYNFDSSNSGIGRHLEFDENSVPYDYFRSFITYAPQMSRLTSF